MKKPVLFSILCLTLSVVACGKKSDDPVAVSGQPVAVAPTAPVTTIYPVPTGYNGLTLQQYCQLYNGQYNGSTCSLTQTTYGQQWSLQFGDLNSGVAVYSGQRVSVATSGNPKILIGGTYQASGNASFVSQVSGYLSFQKYSFSSYSVQSIQVTTCMSSPAQAVACP